MCLFLCKFHTFLATIALKYSLTSETEMLFSSFSRLFWHFVVFYVFIQILGLCALFLLKKDSYWNLGLALDLCIALGKVKSLY